MPAVLSVGGTPPEVRRLEMREAAFGARMVVRLPKGEKGVIGSWVIDHEVLWQ